jgi:pantetheine-phosphate adenylyltransferase
MKKIGFSGTLDPITNGHMWVMGEARLIAEEVEVFLSENPAKQPHFPAEKRKKIIEMSAAERGWDNVRVIIVKGDYTARAAKKRGVDYLIRGIRNTADFDYENLIQQTNVDVLHGAKTLYVMPPRDLGSVSSSFIRGLQGPVGWHWNMRKFVPRPAYEAWIHDWLHKDWIALWQYDTADAQTVAHAEHWFSQLCGQACYGGPGRHYHNLDHLVHGLTEIRVWAANTGADPRQATLLKKAFWFHDAVYGIADGQTSDEEASARMWQDSRLDAAATPAADITAVIDLIRATDHFQESAVTHPLKNAMLGVDLAILGQDEDIYDSYARAIRAEYSHAPEALYRQRRCSALEHLLRKAETENLYLDPYFAEQYNDRAKSNLKREIAILNKTI